MTVRAGVGAGTGVGGGGGVGAAGLGGAGLGGGQTAEPAVTAVGQSRQEAEWLLGWYRPTAHSAHLIWPDELVNVPASQSAQLDDPSLLLNLPEGQRLHPVDLSFSSYCPAAQEIQDLAEADGAYFPCWQSVQLVWSGFGWNFPPGQSSQALPFSYWPGSQLVALAAWTAMRKSSSLIKCAECMMIDMSEQKKRMGKLFSLVSEPEEEQPVHEFWSACPRVF